MLRVVSHTPIECEKLTAAQKAGDWIDAMRAAGAGAGPSSTLGGATASPDWEAADKGRRLDHIWVAPALADRRRGIEIAKRSRAAGRGRPTTCR